MQQETYNKIVGEMNLNLYNKYNSPHIYNNSTSNSYFIYGDISTNGCDWIKQCLIGKKY